MKKEQLIECYHRFRHWQQEGPYYVNRHEDSVQRCQNCGTEFADNYCPRCGQRAEVGRVRWKSISESIAVVFGLDSRSLPNTLVQLLLRPGYLVRDFISGRRQVSYPPVNMLAIVSIIAVIIEIVPFFVLAFLFGDDDRKDAVISAGPQVIAIIILLVAVMLGIAYLISRHQYKKSQLSNL